jgi:DNA polymerase-3 subunit gamma/tau
MTLTLYRKYRPQTFKDVVNQNHIKVTIRNEIETGKVAQAYLFYGPRGIGKTTMARLLAKAVNCEKRKEKESEPCDECPSCQEISDGRALDVIEIDAASHTGVDNVRENIINNARFSPSKSKYKVFIIDEVHMLSVPAFNALLKTLEEPPKHVIFILATTEIHKVPLTIVSRCQRFDFRRIGLADLVESLKGTVRQEGIKVADRILESIARHSEGSIRDAQSLLGQVLALGEKEITPAQAELVIPRSNFNLVAELVEYLIRKNTEGGINLINRLVEDGIDLGQFTADLIEFLRKILLLKISGSLKEFSFELEEEIEKKISLLAKEIEIKKLISIIDLFILKKQELKYAFISQLPLELAVVEIASEGKPISPVSFTGEEEKKTWEGLKAKVLGKVMAGKADESAAAKALADKEVKEENNPIATKINLKQIEEKWNEILKKADEANHSLIYILKVSRPLSLEKNILKLGFKYKFHKDKVSENKIKLVLENILAEVFGEKVLIEGVVVPDLEIESKSGEVEASGPVADVLKAFGGRIVE